MAFDDDIAIDRDGNGSIAPGWETARGPHGGYVMALLARAMEQAAEGRQPRSLTVHFLRPPAVGRVRALATVEENGGPDKAAGVFQDELVRWIPILKTVSMKPE